MTPACGRQGRPKTDDRNCGKPGINPDFHYLSTATGAIADIHIKKYRKAKIGFQIIQYSYIFNNPITKSSMDLLSERLSI